MGLVSTDPMIAKLSTPVNNKEMFTEIMAAFCRVERIFLVSDTNQF